MKMLSAWDISSKGLIFSKIFDESEQDLELQKKALANILVTQEFDMMPVVKKSAKTIGSQTTPGPIEGVAILDDSKANVDIINYEDCPSIPKDTNFVSAIITLLKSKNRFVFVGESTSKAEAIITSSMLTSPDISDALIFLSATTAMEGGISEDASFGLRVYEQILSSLKEETISESCLNNLISLDPKKKVSGVIDSEVTYVPKGGVTAQHIMKFPLAGVTKTIEREYLLAAKMLGEGNDFDNLLLYEKGRKIPDTVVMLSHKDNKRSMCRTIGYDTNLKSIIKYMKNVMKTCVVRPNPDLVIRGEKMVWPAIIYVDNELQSDASLKELGKYCVEVELAEKRRNKIPLEDRTTTLGNLSPHEKERRKQGPGKIKRNSRHRNSEKTNSAFIGQDSLLSARNALFHIVLGGYGKLSLKQMQNIVSIHDSLRAEIQRMNK
jgi:hypothetical protein